MTRTMFAVVVFLSAGVVRPAPAAALGPVVVVFDIQTEGVQLNQGMLTRLGEYLSACLSEAGYRVVLRDKLLERTAQAPCATTECRTRILQELDAQLMIRTRILKFAGVCKVVTSLLKPGKTTAEREASAGDGCREKDLVAAVEQVGDKLRFEEPLPAPPEAPLPDDQSDQTAGSDFTPVIWGSEVGKLSLNSVPWGRVWINGKDTGKNTPLFRHELPAGRHLVSVRSPKGNVASSTVEIWPNEITTLIIRFSVTEPEKKERTGLLLMNTSPWSEVIIDGNIRDMTPLFRKLPPGQHEIKIVFAHGEVLWEAVTIKPNEATKLFRKAKTPESFQYKKGMGLLKLHSFPWGRVMIDGKDLGSAAPVFIQQLPAGKHKMTIWFLSGARMSEEINILEGRTLRKIIRSE